MDTASKKTVLELIEEMRAASTLTNANDSGKAGTIGATNSKTDSVYSFTNADIAEAVKTPRAITEKDLKRAGIGKRYRACTFGAMERYIDDSARGAFEKAKRYAEHFGEYQRGEGLIFSGSIGAGKTSLAIAVMREVMKNGASAYFIPLAELFDKLVTMSKQRDSVEFLEFQRKLKTVRLLVLDDLGTEYPNDWMRNKLDAIISYRYNECMPMIITTNLTAGGIAEGYQMRVLDRIRSVSIPIELNLKESNRRAPREL